MSRFRTSSSESYQAGRDNTVTYSSVSSKGHRAFVAESPANSAHAAKLAELAIAVQEGRSRDRRDARGTPIGAIANAPQRHQTQYIAAGPQDSRGWTAAEGAGQGYATCSMAQQLPRDGHVAHDDIGDDTDYCSECEAMSRPVTEARGGWNPFQRSQRAVQSVMATTTSGTPRVTRYATETETAYSVKSHSGKIDVSAPNGSNEAQLFDAIAEAHTSPRKSHERHDSTRGRSSSWKSIGWFS
ncbi:hypothetical protein BX600DRAFT_119227 [Xylariales sp. PMI_506]|nr:hypothetical protein BX600DRAFT_119227 [Xylariales sp. PMI_506]